MTEKTVGSFLHRVYDDLCQNQENSQRLEAIEERLRELEEKVSESGNCEKSPNWHSEQDLKGNIGDQAVWECRTGDCSYIATSEEAINGHIGGHHDGEGKYQKVGASIGDKSFPDDRRMDEISKGERKHMVREWFEEDCERASTVKRVAEEVFDTPGLKSGDPEYTMVFTVLDELCDEGFLDSFESNNRNRYYCNEHQIAGAVEAF